MELKPKKIGYERWVQELTEWLNSNASMGQYQGHIKNDDFNKYKDEYKNKYKGESPFFDSYFGAIDKYNEAVNDSDNKEEKKRALEALDKAKESKRIDEDETKPEPISRWFGINSLIEAILEELKKLNDKNSTTNGQVP